MNNYDKFKRGIEDNKVPENKAKKIVDTRRKKVAKIVFAVLLVLDLFIFIGLFDCFGKTFANAFYGAFGCASIAGCIILFTLCILKLLGVKGKKLSARTIFYMVVLCALLVLFMQIFSTVNDFKALSDKSFKSYLDTCFLNGRNNAGGATFGILAYPFLSVIGSVTSLCIIAVLFFTVLLVCFRSFFYVERKQTIEWEDSESGGMYIETIDGAKKKSDNANEFSFFHPNDIALDDEVAEKDEDIPDAEIEYGSAQEKLLDDYLNGDTKPEDRKKTAEEILFMSEEEWNKVIKKKEGEETPTFESAIKTGERQPFQTGFSTETANGRSIDTMPKSDGKQTIESAYNIYKEGGLTAEELLFGNIIETPDLTYEELYPQKNKQNAHDAVDDLLFDGENSETKSLTADTLVKDVVFDSPKTDKPSTPVYQGKVLTQNQESAKTVVQRQEHVNIPEQIITQKPVIENVQTVLNSDDMGGIPFSTPSPEVLDTRNAIYDESLDLETEDGGEKDFIIRSRIERPEESEEYVPQDNPYGTVFRVFEEPEVVEDEVEEDEEHVDTDEPKKQALITKPQEIKKEKPKKEKKTARPYQAPSLGLLNEPDPPHCNMDFAGFYHTIEEAFNQYEMPVRVIAHTRGPTFTLYAVQLGNGVYFKRVMSREEDINRKLCCDQPISIVPSVKNMDAIGIEVFYRETRSVVPLKRYLVSEKYKQDKKLFFPIGIDVYGDAYYCDIFGAPHMLIGGTTGSGKSICINTIICTILYNYSPEYVKLILIDPKTVELAAFATIPHSLLGRTINNPADSVKALAWAVNEMQRRYDIMAESQMKNIASYNDYMKEKGEPTLPYIVIVIDELADLMLRDRKIAPDLENNINLLTAKSRACGIHLILATQRPSKEIVTGLIKNNVSTRIAFTMGDVVASKVILDKGGAEKLYGKGDLLYSSPEYSQPLRLQAPYVSEKEVNEITDTVKANNDLIIDENIVNAIFNDKPTSTEAMIESSYDDTSKSSASELREKNFEELLKEVIVFAVRQGVISISKIQRQFNIGFLKAGNIIDRMEEMGIVGPSYPGSSRPRDVLITMDDLPKYIGDDYGN